jgi:hypothetical protein
MKEKRMNYLKSISFILLALDLVTTKGLAQQVADPNFV